MSSAASGDASPPDASSPKFRTGDGSRGPVRPSGASAASASGVSSASSSVRPASPPSSAEFRAAVAAAASPSIRPPPSPAPVRERFADLKWMYSRRMVSPSTLTRDQIESMVLSSARVQAAIERATVGSQQAGSSASASSATPAFQSRDEATKAAKAVFNSMYADVNQATVRTAIYLMRKIWRGMYEGIRVNEDGIERLHEFARARVPVILLPMHKSHVAGDNLNMPLVGPMLRHGGGLFIRRVFGGDELYKAVFAEYVAVLLTAGHSLEVFIEGTRSRSGKVKRPKTGVMSVLVDLAASGRLGAKDIMLVPISISYDKVIEGTSYVNEMLGAKKQKESLTATLNSVNHVVRLNFGSIDVSICAAISLRETLGLSASGGSGALLREGAVWRNLSQAEQKRLVMSVAHRCCYEMNRRLVVSATSVIASVLLTHVHRGIARREIVRRCESLRGMIVERGAQVAHIFSTEPLGAVVERALRVLSKLVQEQHGIVFGFRGVTALELSFYRNQLLHIFVAESLVCVAVAAEIEHGGRTHGAAGLGAEGGGPNDGGSSESSSTGATLDGSGSSSPLAPGASLARIQVLKSRVIASVKFISQLLKFEFIFQPAPDIESNVEETIDLLIQRGMLIGSGPQSAATAASASPAAGVPSSSSASPSSPPLPASSCTHLSLNPAGLDSFLFLCMLTWPFVETYFVALASLMMLLPDVIMESSKLSTLASRRAEALFYSGGVRFYEALSTEGISGAFDWAVSQGILRVHAVGHTRMLQLTPEYQESPAARAEEEQEEKERERSAAAADIPSAAVSIPSVSSSPAVLGSATKRLTLERLGDDSSSSAWSPQRKSLRALVRRVGHFRKSRLLASEQTRPSLDAFLEEPASATTATTSTAATSAAQAAAAAAQAARGVLRLPMLKAHL